MPKKYLYFAVFSSGLATLAFEFAASRLLGSVFGTSNLVWASIVGLIMIYLTVGYFLGGKLADKYPDFTVFMRIMLVGAFTAGLIPLVSKPVLRAAADAFDQLHIAVLAGSFVSVLVLFIVPISLLGTSSPFAIRLAVDTAESAGQVSGRIYAISTLGSFVGTFLPDLVLIPLIGTSWTFVVFSLFLMAVALIGLILAQGFRKTMIWFLLPGILLIMAAFVASGAIKRSDGQIYEVESSYNYIQVIQDGDYRYLRLNEGQGIHSVYAPDQIAFGGTWMQFLAGPFFNTAPHPMEAVESVAIIGLAAGTTARQATYIFGDIPIDGYEIDPRIIQVGRDYFDMNMPNLNAIAEDGRWGLEHSGKQYSLICIDAYRPPYIPWHLTTQEFFQITKDHLTQDGVLAINVGRADTDRRLIDVLVSTLSQVYPSVHIMDIPYTFNSMVYATVQPTNYDDLEANLIYLHEEGADNILLESIFKTLQNQQPLPEPAMVFTDDRAPVEALVNGMVLRFILQGNQELIQ